MVGDTPADTLMGQKAKLGLTVGVLSGVGAKEDLADADVIVGNVTNCVEMILEQNPNRIHQVKNFIDLRCLSTMRRSRRS